MTPELSLDYTSATESSWAGSGWDLGVGTIEVDTSFGVPYFDPAKESESYSLDGTMLVPNALGDTWQDRIADRQDFTRQVETEYEQIIRHGDSPKNYWWEVRDKMGGIRWYGAKPDAGGPMGGPLGVTRGFVEPGPNTGALDPDSVVTDDDHNIVKWLLSAERDVGVNMFRYEYEPLRYRFDETTGAWVADAACVDGLETLCARHTYLRSVFYTEAAEASDENHPVEGYHEQPPYEIRFVRMTERTNPSTNLPYGLRMDTTLDATGRYLDLLAEQLASVEVWWDDLQVDGGRDYDQLATRYDLGYATGPFGKTLLSTVTQGAGTADAVTHTFTYFNDVKYAAGSYTGFATDGPWDTGDTGALDDIGDRAFLDENISGGALGGSESNSAEGHVYVGFNPAVPQKVGSFGASIQIGGGQTDGIEELIDLNGDGLPDKVFMAPGKKDANDDVQNVWYRLNRGGPGGELRFGEAVAPLDPQRQGTLARPRVPAAGLARGPHRRDRLVRRRRGRGVGRRVLHRRERRRAARPRAPGRGVLQPAGGRRPHLPRRQHGHSGGIGHRRHGARGEQHGTRPAAAAPAAGLASDRHRSTLDRAVRRHDLGGGRRRTQPHRGRRRTRAPDPDARRRPTTEFAWPSSSTRSRSSPRRSPPPATARSTRRPCSTCTRGDRVYLRVGSLDDGAHDEVAWSPQITYTTIDGAAVVDEDSVDPVPDDTTEVPLDVNGLSQTVYNAAADFTLAGRPNTRVVMPYDGTVRFSATVVKSKATSDDLRLVLDHTDAVPAPVIPVDIPDAAGTPEGGGASVPIVDGVIPAGFVGTVDFQADVAVSGPVAAVVDPDPDVEEPETDTLHAHLAVDSTIDLTAISWNPAIHYTEATDENGESIEVQKMIQGVLTDTKRVELAPEIEQYPNRSSAQVVRELGRRGRRRLRRGPDRAPVAQLGCRRTAEPGCRAEHQDARRAGVEEGDHPRGIRRPDRRRSERPVQRRRVDLARGRRELLVRAQRPRARARRRARTGPLLGDARGGRRGARRRDAPGRPHLDWSAGHLPPGVPGLGCRWIHGERRLGDHPDRRGRLRHRRSRPAGR